mmetsp:Transcript_10039/g.23920  ORF Transcript_10039/g.23920 Transcript_10039/m.23920 type:complete len:428 (-) Transcript_10039:176-1459(-)
MSSSIPRKRGRDIYSQTTPGIMQKLKRISARKRQLANQGSNTTTDVPTEEEMTKRREEALQRLKRRQKHLPRGQRKVYRKPGGPPRRQLLLEEEGEQQNTLRPEHSPRDNGNDSDSAGGDSAANMQEVTQQQQQETAPRKSSGQRTTNWDPDEKMKRYFERRKIFYKQDPSQVKKMVLDMTPNYMFHSDRVPARIECLVPWVKVFVILRDPMDRARSQYDMKLRVVKNGKLNNKGTKTKDDSSTTVLQNLWGNPVPSLDQFVLQDLEALYEVGVFQDWTKVDFESFWASEKCRQAWQTYIHLGLNAPIGMGLYALQLKPFLEMIERVHSAENVKDYFMALDNQDLRKDPDVTYNRLLKFLNLQPKTLEQYKTTINQATGHNDDGKLGNSNMYQLSKSTEDRIRAAIKPYNQKLGELLGEEWGTKWEE